MTTCWVLEIKTCSDVDLVKKQIEEMGVKIRFVFDWKFITMGASNEVDITVEGTLEQVESMRKLSIINSYRPLESAQI